MKLHSEQAMMHFYNYYSLYERLKLRLKLILQTNSFQLALVSNNETSFAVFTYECGSLNWARNRVSIGYSGGEDFFFNLHLSRARDVTCISCLNLPTTPWMNVVFNSKNSKQQ